MALIGKIRKHSALLVVVIGVALAAFVLGDFVKSKPRSATDVGEVNGEEITYREFNKKFEENIENEKQNQRKENLTADENFDIRQRTWNQMVYNIIMEDEYDGLGIAVSSDELFEQVQGKNPHRYILQYFADPETGQYNPAQVLNFLKQLDQMKPADVHQWLNFERAIKEDRLNTKYMNLVSKGYYVPQAFAKKDFENKNRKAKIKYVALKYTEIPDSLANFTEGDLEKYYKNHIYQYKQEATRDIDYVIFEVKPSAEDHKKIREEVNEIYNEFKLTDNINNFVNATSDNRYDSTFFMEGNLPVQIDSIMFNSKIGTFIPPYIEDNAYHMSKLIDIQYRPDSMKSSHVLIAYRGALGSNQEVTRTREEAQTIADSLFNVIKKKPNKLEEIAITISDDPSAKKNTGDLGWFADQTMIGPYNKAVLDGRIADIELVETPYGFHIIKITGKKKPVKKVRVAIIDRAIEPGGQTFQDVYIQASKFAGENTTKETFEKSVIDQGINKRTAPNVREMANIIAGLNYPRSIVRWAFDVNTEEGNVSPIFDMDGKYVIAIVTKVNEKGNVPLKDIESNIEGFVIKNKKAEIIYEKIDESSDDIDKISKNLNSEVKTVETVNFGSPNIPGIGHEPDVVGEIFALDKDELSKPIQGKSGVFVIFLEEFIEPAEVSDYSFNIIQMESNFDRKVKNNYVYRALEKIADIADNRVMFY